MVLLTLQAIEISTFFLDYNRMKRSIYENVRKALRLVILNNHVPSDLQEQLVVGLLMKLQIPASGSPVYANLNDFIDGCEYFINKNGNAATGKIYEFTSYSYGSRILIIMILHVLYGLLANLLMVAW